MAGLSPAAAAHGSQAWCIQYSITQLDEFARGNATVVVTPAVKAELVFPIADFCIRC